MEITFEELREKEVINAATGKKMGRIADAVFNLKTSELKGFILFGERKFFQKSEEIFVPLKNVHKIGDDVILIYFKVADDCKKSNKSVSARQNLREDGSFVRFRRIMSNKYK